MGNHHMSFTGYGGTPERACVSLEEDIRKIYPNAFVTISDDELKVVTLSPRSVARLAIANVGDGKCYPVSFEKDKYGIMCHVKV